MYFVEIYLHMFKESAIIQMVTQHLLREVVMEQPNIERRRVLKAAAYTVPVVMTLQAAPTFAKNGSVKLKCNNGHGNGGEGCDATDNPNANQERENDTQSAIKA